MLHLLRALPPDSVGGHVESMDACLQDALTTLAGVAHVGGRCASTTCLAGPARRFWSRQPRSQTPCCLCWQLGFVS
eukprot:2768325-Karenia_brevis.AAC.1